MPPAGCTSKLSVVQLGPRLPVCWGGTLKRTDCDAETKAKREACHIPVGTFGLTSYAIVPTVDTKSCDRGLTCFQRQSCHKRFSRGFILALGIEASHSES